MPAKIRDKFSKIPSRQRRYQQRKRRQGRCTVCGQKAVKHSDVCVRHLVQRRESARTKNGATRRNHGARSYKLNAALQPQALESKVA